MVDLSAIKSRLSWSIFLKLATAILAFAFTAVISRFLSLTDAGSFFYFMAGLILLSTIALAGQDIFAMRLTARLTASHDYSELILRQAAMRRRVFISSSVVSLILIFFSNFPGVKLWEAELWLIVSLVVGVPLFSATVINCEVLRGAGWLQSLVIIHGALIPAIASLIILSMSLVVTISLNNALLSYLFSVFLAWVVSEICLRKVVNGWPCGDTAMHDDIKQHGGSDDNSVAWLAILAMTNLGLQHFPIIVLGYAEDQSDAALFFVAFKLSILLSFCLMAINVVTAPLMAKAHQLSDYLRLRELMIISILGGFVSSTPIALLLLAYGEFILGLFGDGYPSAFPVLKVLMLGQLVNACCGSVLNLLVMTGNEKSAAIITCSGLAAMCFLAFLVESVTVLGVAWILTVSLIGINVTALFVGYYLLSRIKHGY